MLRFVVLVLVAWCVVCPALALATNPSDGISAISAKTPAQVGPPIKIGMARNEVTKTLPIESLEIAFQRNGCIFCVYKISDSRFIVKYERPLRVVGEDAPALFVNDIYLISAKIKLFAWQKD